MALLGGQAPDSRRIDLARQAEHRHERPDPVTHTGRVGVQAVGVLALPRRSGGRPKINERQAPLGRQVTEQRVGPDRLGSLDPLRHRGQDRAVRDGGHQLRQLFEQHRQRRLAEVVATDDGGHQVRSPAQPGQVGEPRQLDLEHVGDDGARPGQVQYPPGPAVAQGELPSYPLDVAVLDVRQTDGLRGRVAEHHPQRIALPLTGQQLAGPPVPLQAMRRHLVQAATKWRHEPQQPLALTDHVASDHRNDTAGTPHRARGGRHRDLRVRGRLLAAT